MHYDKNIKYRTKGLVGYRSYINAFIKGIVQNHPWNYGIGMRSLVIFVNFLEELCSLLECDIQLEFNSEVTSAISVTVSARFVVSCVK